MICVLSWADPEGGPPLENHKNLGFLSNTGPDPLKITKLPSQHSIWAIIGTPAKRHLNCVAGGPMMARYSGRVKTSNFGRFFAVSLLQHGLCFAPDMSPS